MKILAIMRPRDGVNVRSALAQHGRRELHTLWQLYADDVVRDMYSPGGPGAVLILESESLRTAADRLARLPLIESDAMSLELIALEPFKPLEMLFT